MDIDTSQINSYGIKWLLKYVMSADSSVSRIKQLLNL